MLSRQVHSADRYSPYPINWGFLPEPLLLMKDAIRHVIAGAVVGSAQLPVVRPYWSRIFGAAIRKTVVARGLLFIHIPKTGGTSISKALYGRNLPHFTATFYRDVFGDELADLPSFAIVRDPVERLHSAFRFLQRGGTDIILTDRYEMLKSRKFKKFEDFVVALLEDRTLMQSALSFKPQCEFILDSEGKLQVDRVFALNRGDFSAELYNFLGTEIPHLNATGKRSGERQDSEMHAAIRRLYPEDSQLFDIASNNWKNSMIAEKSEITGCGKSHQNELLPEAVL